MSSSVFVEAPSARRAAEGDSNLVVVYSKNGISFDERAMENLMEEKSIATISVVRITSPTPSMVDQEEAERLKELEQFLDAATDSEWDSDNGSQSGGDDVKSEVDHNPPDDDNNTDDEVNDDSTETETEAPKTRKRPGRKPKVIKKKKRRKPKERPQIVGLRVEQFYAEGTADILVKNALKLAGLSIFKRTPETDAVLEVIKNDHNYTPFTSLEQMKLHKKAEKIAMEKQAQSRKIVMQSPGNVKIINAKKRMPAMPFTPLQAKVHRLPVQPPQQEQPLPRKHQPKPTPTLPLPRERREIVTNSMLSARPRSGRSIVKVMAPVDDSIEDDEEADSSDPAEDENADKLYDTEEMSEESDDFQDTDNDRDSDMDFKMRHDSRSSNKRKRARKISSRPTRQSKPLPPHPAPPQQQFPELKRRKEQVLLRREQVAQSAPQRRELVPQSVAQRREPVPQSLAQRRELVTQITPQRRDPVQQSSAQRREPLPQSSAQRRELVPQITQQRRELSPQISQQRREQSPQITQQRREQSPHITQQRKEMVKQTAPQRKEQLPQTAIQRKEQMQPAATQRKEQQSAPQIGQIIQLPTPKAPPTVIPLGRGITSTSFLKIRPTHQTLAMRKPPLSSEALGLASTGGKVRRTPLVHVGKVLNTSAPSGYSTPPPQDVKEIIINKNTSSPKGVFTNLNSLLGENHAANMKSSPDPHRQRSNMSPVTPRSSYAANVQQSPVAVAVTVPVPAKGFMPIGVGTAQSHKLPSQIVIETHQSSSELAAENDKQLDLIDSIVKDELLKTTLVEQPAVVNADENIPKLVKMLESTASVLDQGPAAAAAAAVVAATVSMPAVKQDEIFTDYVQPVVTQGLLNAVVPVDDNDAIDLDTARLLNTPDEDAITADFLQHVVGLIEEDKHFKAEVEKQVLAIADPGGLDAIVSLPPPVEALVHPSIMHTSSSEPHPPAVLAEHSHLLTPMPMACSTPSRSSAVTAPASVGAQMRPEGKVVRGNGRVIYLPPIEAPTTRAKRRAQFTPTNSAASSSGDLNLSSVTILDVTLDSSSFSNESQTPHKPGVVPKRANPREPSLARRSTVPRRTKKLNASQSNDTEASESQEDDDDPNKLWCICRQPHNNRFMICCDLCEDWFHGTCVGVTKSMGIEMEQKSIMWKCPKCVKKQEEKNQPRITDMLIMRPAIQTEETSSETKVLTEPVAPQPNRTLPMGVTVATAPLRSSLTKRMPTNQQQPPGKMMLQKPQQQQQLQFVKLGAPSATSCVVCRRLTAGSQSVYCSDECIRKYAQNAVQAQTSAKSPDSPVSPMSLDMQSAQMNSPNSAEAAKRHKKKDLFEDVLRQADAVSKIERINVIERKSGRVITGHLAPIAQHFRKWLQDNPTFEVLPSGSFQSLDTEKRQFKRISDTPATPETSPAVTKLPTSATKVQQQLRVATPPIHALPKRDNNKPLAHVVAPRSPSKPEPIRLNVRRTLKEQLLARIKEAQDAEPGSSSSTTTQWLTAIEAEQFVKSVESEMYHSFGCDVGAKYKSKYRSLMFNIKDRKNKTLFEKICAKQVEPKQLVAMTPEELASQELAKWREEETRHQLEIIKKSELDMLSCTQNYVLKTHKGEEEIAPKLDVTLPEESFLESDTKHNSQMSDHDSSSKDVSVEHASSREKSGSSKEKRHKSHKRHHQHKRSRSRSSSQTRSLEKRHRRHHNDVETGGERTHRHHDKQRSKDRDERIPTPTKRREENDRAALPREKKPEETRGGTRHAYNLIDKTLESTKTMDNSPKQQHPVKAIPSTTVAAKAATPAASPVSPVDSYTRYLQGLPKRTLWSGSLSMIDVANFQVVAHPLLSNSHQLPKLMPVKLDVIGRIARLNVWEYIKKINKIPTKEVVLVNLFPSGPSEIKKFDHFFEYLDSRQRLGVIQAEADQIRDFYIFPLGSKDKLPSVLEHITELVPFYEDTERPNTLMGIMVHCLPTSLSAPATSSSSSKAAKKSRSTTSFTPPSSPRRKPSNHSTSSKDDEFDIDAIIKAPIAKMRKTATVPPAVPMPALPALKDDANEPYSPGGSSGDECVTAPAPASSLARQMDELNKQIAAQKLEIEDLLNVEPSGSALSRISFPPDLPKILASIKDKSDSAAKVGDSEEYNPEDAITTLRPYATAATTKSKGRLAHLSEAELLSMVPDNLVDLVPPTTSKNRLHNPPPPNT
ncbi:uncharacterized protein LOC117898576 isoform X3 [Drosophila subobscura]|uniref:uncharacterized protein LOC117898576 isoform X3 n=1 Tax=Drosophila subobscura TaxID=7241 RepID=UPI00155AA3F5|nr:uncharacterized protein LOC117898576 isoform X3 [Drosophila subobscura]